MMFVSAEVLGPDAALTRERMRLEAHGVLWGVWGLDYDLRVRAFPS